MGCDVYCHIEYSRDGREWCLYTGYPYKFEPEYDKVPADAWMHPGRTRDMYGIISGIGSYSICTYQGFNGLELATLAAEFGLDTICVGRSRGWPNDLSPDVAKWLEDEEKYHPQGKERGGGHLPDSQGFLRDQYASWGTLDDLLFWMKLCKDRHGSWYGWTKIRNAMLRLRGRGYQTRVLFWFSY